MAVATFFCECLYFLVWLLDIQYVLKTFKTTDSDEYRFNVVYGVSLILGAGTCFVFAALLCYGVWKKKPGYLKAYLVFGVLVDCLGLVTTLAFMLTKAHDEEQRVASVVALVCCAVYPWLLLLVARTYRVFSAAANGFCKAHQPVHGL